MNKPYTSLAIAVVLSIGPVSVEAGALLTTFVDSDLGISVLAEIDPENGVVTVVGPMTGNIQGLAFDSKNNVLYATGTVGNDSHLYRVDPANGATTFVGSMGFEGAGALAYDQLNDVLYGGGGDDQDSVLVMVDRISGAATEVGATEFGTSSLEYLPTTDRLLFTWNANWFGEIDRATAGQTLIGFTGAGFLFGMGYEPDADILYALAGTSRSILYELDLKTGVATEFVTLSRMELYASMAVIPEPGTMLLLFAGLLGMIVFVVHQRRIMASA